MIYLSKNNATTVITDNVVNIELAEFDVYLDDILIGTFENLSRNNKYLKFICPEQELTEREYTMRILYNQAIIKEELVIVKDLSNLTPKSVSKPKQIKMYEK